MMNLPCCGFENGKNINTFNLFSPEFKEHCESKELALKIRDVSKDMFNVILNCSRHYRISNHKLIIQKAAISKLIDERDYIETFKLADEIISVVEEKDMFLKSIHLKIAKNLSKQGTNTGWQEISHFDKNMQKDLQLAYLETILARNVKKAINLYKISSFENLDLNVDFIKSLIEKQYYSEAFSLLCVSPHYCHNKNFSDGAKERIKLIISNLRDINTMQLAKRILQKQKGRFFYELLNFYFDNLNKGIPPIDLENFLNDLFKSKIDRINKNIWPYLIVARSYLENNDQKGFSRIIEKSNQKNLKFFELEKINFENEKFLDKKKYAKWSKEILNTLRRGEHSIISVLNYKTYLMQMYNIFIFHQAYQEAFDIKTELDEILQKLVEG